MVKSVMRVVYLLCVSTSALRIRVGLEADEHEIASNFSKASSDLSMIQQKTNLNGTQGVPYLCMNLQWGCSLPIPFPHLKVCCEFCLNIWAPLQCRSYTPYTPAPTPAAHHSLTGDLCTSALSQLRTYQKATQWTITEAPKRGKYDGKKGDHGFVVFFFEDVSTCESIAADGAVSTALTGGDAKYFDMGYSELYYFNEEAAAGKKMSQGLQCGVNCMTYGRSGDDVIDGSYYYTGGAVSLVGKKKHKQHKKQQKKQPKMKKARNKVGLLQNASIKELIQSTRMTCGTGNRMSLTTLGMSLTYYSYFPVTGGGSPTSSLAKTCTGVLPIPSSIVGAMGKCVVPNNTMVDACTGLSATGPMGTGTGAILMCGDYAWCDQHDWAGCSSDSSETRNSAYLISECSVKGA